MARTVPRLKGALSPPLLPPTRINALSGISVAGTRDFHSTSEATSSVIDIPDGANTVGRLVIIAINVDGQTLPTWPAGWSVLTEGADGSGSPGRMRASVRYRVVDGTEGWSGSGDTITVTHPSEQRVWYTWLIENWDSGSPPEAAAAVGANGMPNSPNLAPSWGEDDALVIAIEFNDGSDSVVTYPSGYTDGQHYGSSASPGGGVQHGMAQRVQRAASYDPSAWVDTSSSNSWRAVTIAIRQ